MATCWEKLTQPETHNELSATISYAKTRSRPTVGVVFGVLNLSQGAFVYSLVDLFWTLALCATWITVSKKADNGISITNYVTIFIRFFIGIASIYIVLGLGRLSGDGMANACLIAQLVFALFFVVVDILVLSLLPAVVCIFIFDIFLVVFMCIPKFLVFASVLKGPSIEVPKPAVPTLAPLAQVEGQV